MNSVSEIDLQNGNNTLKTVDIHTSKSPTNTSIPSVTKVDSTDAQRLKSPTPTSDKYVPVDDLNLLMNHTKSNSLPKAGQESDVSLSIVKPSGSSNNTMNTFLDKTTDLSDILNKKSDDDFIFKPSIDVTKNVDLPKSLPTVNTNTSSLFPPTTSVSNTIPTNTKNDSSKKSTSTEGGLFSSLFGKPSNQSDTTKTTPSVNTENTTKNNSGSIPVPVKLEQTEAEKQKEKQQLLFKLNRLRSRGMPVSKRYTMSSPLEEVRNEFLNLKAQRDIHNSVKFQRKMMMAVVTGVEFMNTKFDPFDIKLDGWSESVHENINDYDEIFEELHEKHKEKAKMAPETKLFFSLAGSAFMFHLTQSLFKSSMPNMQDVMYQNPEMMKQFAQAAVGAHDHTQQHAPASPQYQTQPPTSDYNAYRGGQGSSNMGGGGGGGGGGGIGNLLSGLMGGGSDNSGLGGLGGLMSGLSAMGGGESPHASDAESSYGAGTVKRQEMTGPKGVDDILAQLNTKKPATTVSPMDTQNKLNQQSVENLSHNTNQRLSGVTKATPDDIKELEHTMKKIDTASSGYRKRLSDGMKLNI